MYYITLSVVLPVFIFNSSVLCDVGVSMLEQAVGASASFILSGLFQKFIVYFHVLFLFLKCFVCLFVSFIQNSCYNILLHILFFKTLRVNLTCSESRNQSVIQRIYESECCSLNIPC